MTVLRIQHILIVSFLIVIGSSCGRLFLGADPAATPMVVFDDLASNIELRYSLLNDKSLDWQAISKKHRARIDAEMTDDSLFQVLNELLGELNDGHVNIRTISDRGRNWDWKLDYPSNFDMDIVERNYLGRNHKRTANFWNTIIDSIGYVYYGSFSPPINKKTMNALFENMKDTKGLIFDVRNNGGGKLENCRLIASYFADTLTDCMQFYYKSGPGKDDFDGPHAFEITPVDTMGYLKPVVVLTNRSSYSGATFFPAMMSAYPHVTIMGDTTGGGGGIPWNYELPNGWIYRYSTSRTFDCEGRNIEFGVPPDIEVHLDPTDEANGVDSIIEQAMEELNKNW